METKEALTMTPAEYAKAEREKAEAQAAAIRKAQRARREAEEKKIENLKNRVSDNFYFLESAILSSVFTCVIATLIALIVTHDVTETILYIVAILIIIAIIGFLLNVCDELGVFFILLGILGLPLGFIFYPIAFKKKKAAKTEIAALTEALAAMEPENARELSECTRRCEERIAQYTATYTEKAGDLVEKYRKNPIVVQLAEQTAENFLNDPFHGIHKTCETDKTTKKIEWMALIEKTMFRSAHLTWDKKWDMLGFIAYIFAENNCAPLPDSKAVFAFATVVEEIVKARIKEGYHEEFEGMEHAVTSETKFGENSIQITFTFTRTHATPMHTW